MKIEATRPYYYNQIEELSLILCQTMGWFDGLTLAQITEEMKKEFYWKSNFQYACASYEFWKHEFI